MYIYKGGIHVYIYKGGPWRSLACHRQLSEAWGGGCEWRTRQQLAVVLLLLPKHHTAENECLGFLLFIKGGPSSCLLMVLLTC